MALPLIIWTIYKLTKSSSKQKLTRKNLLAKTLFKLSKYNTHSLAVKQQIYTDIMSFSEVTRRDVFGEYMELVEEYGKSSVLSNILVVNAVTDKFKVYVDMKIPQFVSENVYDNNKVNVNRTVVRPFFKAENVYDNNKSSINRTLLKHQFKTESLDDFDIDYCPKCTELEEYQWYETNLKYPKREEFPPNLVCYNCKFNLEVEAPVMEVHSFTVTEELKYIPNTPIMLEELPNLSPFRMETFKQYEAQFLSDQNTQEIINSSIFSNLYHLEIYHPCKLVQRCNILFIRGQLAVTNAHCLHKCLPESILHISNSHLEMSVPFHTISIFRIKRDNVDRDLVYLVFPRKYVPAQKDISSKFLPLDQLTRHFRTTAVCTSYRRTSITGAPLLLTFHYTDMIYYSPNLFNNSASGNLYDFHYHRSTTSQGDCGAPLMILDKRTPSKIIGIHSAGAEDSGLSLFISREELAFAISNFSPHSLCVQNFSESIKFNSPLEYNKKEEFTLPELRPGNFTPIASVKNSIYIPDKTKIQKSILYDQVFPHTTIPAILKSSPSLNIYENNLRKYFDKTYNISPRTLDYIKHRLIHRFKGAQFNILSLEDSIKGTDILVPLDRTTSAGIPWIFHKSSIKGKGLWLGQNENWIVDNVDLLKKIAYFEKSVITKNQIPPIFFLDQTKDERRPISKVNQGKTRMFAVGPMHFSILFRKYFSWFDSHCKQFRIKNGSLVGIDPYSNEWTKVFHHMSEVNDVDSNCFLAGDYSNFDGSLNRSILWTIFESIIEIGKIDIKSDNYKIMLALWTCLTDSLHIHKSQIYQLNHSQPSGNPFTTIINTMYNLGILDFVIFRILEVNNKLVDNLDQHYHAYAYGDDNVIIFSNYFKENINPLEITKVLDDMGHTYTTDLKDGTSQAYRSISEISILKRKFNFDRQLFYCFAPLELDTILEMINWDKETNYNTKLQQLFANAETMQRELLHHSETTYTKYWTNSTLPAVMKLGYQNERVLPYPFLRNLYSSQSLNN
jgi:hypothetical protein